MLGTQDANRKVVFSFDPVKSNIIPKTENITAKYIAVDNDIIDSARSGPVSDMMKVVGMNIIAIEAKNIKEKRIENFFIWFELYLFFRKTEPNTSHGRENKMR